LEVESSPLTIKDLRRSCLAVLSRELFNEITAHLSEDIVQDLINMMAIRKPYGVKTKLASIYTDTNPMAFWCWEVTDTSLLEPVAKSQIEKSRA
jgi:hypothetical protein